MPMRRIRVIVVVLLILGLLAVGAAGQFLIQPDQHAIGNPPADLPTERVMLTAADGYRISGWLIAGQASHGVVLLVHGVRADRRDMLPRAHFLHRLGYRVMLIDLPAHGESSGDFISYGVHDALAVTAALNYLHWHYPTEHIGAIGVSLGAAAVVLSQPKPALDAVVLESMFPTIEQAVGNRLDYRLGTEAHLLSPLLLWQLPLRLHISPAQLRPISVIGQLHSPLLIAGGAIDRYTPPNETVQLYNAAQPPKSLWIVPGAAHVDLFDHDPVTYEAKVGGFLWQYLPQKPDAGQLEDKR
jgi:pimeloyl-ACP methyl ester carboxylesterase